jgi:hypothetical protein
MSDQNTQLNAAAAGKFDLGGDLSVNRMGFGAMRITGEGIWGEPENPEEARRVLRRTLELGINLIDTADSYGPKVSERLIAETLHPYPEALVIATKGGLTRPGPGRWAPNGPARASARSVRREPQAAESRPHRPLPIASHRPTCPPRGADGYSGRAARGGEDPARGPL